MANNEIKTNAEIYREQRKARLAKAAKKKNSGNHDKAKSIIVKVICIVLVAGVVLYAAGSLLTNVFCLPQKTLTAAEYNGKKITVAEYNYYYMSLYNGIADVYQQYEQYYGAGYGKMATGFDLTIDPAEQDYTGSDAPEGVTTWADYFKAMAPEKAFISNAIYEKAMADEKFELTDDMKKEIKENIDAAIEQYAESAKKQNFSLNNFISKAIGAGLTEKSYRALLEKDLIVSKYQTWFAENAAAELTDDDVKAYYEEHKEDYDVVTARVFSVAYAAEDAEDAAEGAPTEAEAKATAEAMLAKVTDDKTFTNIAKEFAAEADKANFENDSATLVSGVAKSDIAKSVPELAEWLFDSARAKGDKAVINSADASAYFVAYLTEPAAPVITTAGADVRHILVQVATTTEDTEGNKIALSDEEIAKNWEAAKKEADEILAEWKAGDATEESFAALAKEKTDDTGSAETGGLYEDVNESSNYVPEFKAWAIASHKAGDTGIVKTSYGYHIMYFVGADEEAKWESDVRAAVSSEKTSELSDTIFEEVDGNVKMNDTIVNYFVGECEKKLKMNASEYAKSAKGGTVTY